jgi:hypothetical protein
MTAQILLYTADKRLLGMWRRSGFEVDVQMGKAACASHFPQVAEPPCLLQIPPDPTKVATGQSPARALAKPPERRRCCR